MSKPNSKLDIITIPRDRQDDLNGRSFSIEKEARSTCAQAYCLNHLTQLRRPPIQEQENKLH